jgi:hypothetical protein
MEDQERAQGNADPSPPLDDPAGEEAHRQELAAIEEAIEQAMAYMDAGFQRDHERVGVIYHRSEDGSEQRVSVLVYGMLAAVAAGLALAADGLLRRVAEMGVRSEVSE